jgi:hypothetical protein
MRSHRPRASSSRSYSFAIASTAPSWTHRKVPVNTKDRTVIFSDVVLLIGLIFY